MTNGLSMLKNGNQKNHRTVSLLSILCLAAENKPVKSTSQISEKSDAEPSEEDDLIRIYSTRNCPYCDRVIIVAKLKGLRFEVVNVDLQKKPKWFTTKHPEGTVPVLEHKGNVMADSRVILEYLEEMFPEKGILSKEPHLKAKQRYYALKLESVCEAIRHMSYTTKLTGDTATLAKKLAMAEKLLKSDFYSGNKVGLPDIILFPFIHRLHIIRQIIKDVFLDSYFPHNYPKIVKWFIKMRSVPEIKEVQEAEHHLRAVLIGKATHNGTIFEAEMEPISDDLSLIENFSAIQSSRNN